MSVVNYIGPYERYGGEDLSFSVLYYIRTISV